MDAQSPPPPTPAAATPPHSYRRLDAGRILNTIARLSERIAARFPGSGLGKVCNDLLEIGQQAEARVEQIERPIWSLRLAIWLLVALLVAAGAATLLLVRLPARLDLADLIQTLEAGTNEVLLVGATIYFLVSLERRIKRRRALAALHELRSLAHIIDMHQLTKDPERLVAGWQETSVSPVQQMPAFKLHRYLDYASEMLALVSKIAALHVRRFDDDVVLQAVNEIEELTSGLSHKIWQKISILDRMGAGRDAAAAVE